MLQSPRSRREFLHVLAGLFLASQFKSAKALALIGPKLGVHLPDPVPTWTQGFVEQGPRNGAARDNFRLVYSNPQLREEFKSFLVSVYHLYPENEFHQLILEATQKSTNDKEAYEILQPTIAHIKPFLSELTYALPALAKQKEEMAAQTAKLLADKPIEGYVEIGTPGRYVTHLQKSLKMSGRVVLVHDHEPAFAPLDIAERGSLPRVGEYVPLGNYATWTEAQLPTAGVDVITNYIGIHHSPRDRLDGFVRSIHRALRPGGRFVLRDHDANSLEENAIVGLAHDVFNAGLGVPWEKNEKELRYFKPIGAIRDYLAKMGFEKAAEPLYQHGDPTKNALMLFVKKA
jgi:SAM-dependent methyltransferase